MNAAEAARRLGIGRALVTRYLQDTRLAGTRDAAGNWQITEQALEEFRAIPRAAGRPQGARTRRRTPRGI